MPLIYYIKGKEMQMSKEEYKKMLDDEEKKERKRYERWRKKSIKNNTLKINNLILEE